ncbi:MAG TPA: DUF5777 family beta-barrel protein [Sphingobacteriaceae bacterium]|nr:DUF5777 family beta-barrel protein [Sphingobacteriaceae bacterium]
MKFTYILCLFIIYAWPNYTARAQDDSLFNELDTMVEIDRQEVIAAFKSTRVILAPSIERVKNNQLHFRISHLFFRINSGYRNLFGLDQLVNMNLIFDYGLTDDIQIGLSRSNKIDKTLMPNMKISLARQSTGKKPFPLYVSYFGSLDWKTNRYSDKERNDNFLGRLDYVNMLLLGRKFNSHLSLQLSPFFIHRNLTEALSEPNNLYGVGFSGRYMLNDHVSTNFEYFYNYPSVKTIQLSKNPLSLGFDIETGGHVFQLFFSNAQALYPGRFLLNQNDNFFKGNIQFGFSILREFNL